MAWAYFDETIVEEKDPATGRTTPTDLLVGGCVSSEAKWRKLEVQWKKALKAERVTTFHAKDFYAFKREFEWYQDGKRDYARHEAFRDRLADIIAEHTDEAIAFTSQISMKKGRLRQSYGDAVARALHRFDRTVHGSEPACLIFANHPELSRWTLLRYFENMTAHSSLRGCGVFDPRDVIPLQAADFVCHAVNKSWGGLQTKSERRLAEGYRSRDKTFTVQLGSSWKPAGAEVTRA